MVRWARRVALVPFLAVTSCVGGLPPPRTDTLAIAVAPALNCQITPVASASLSAARGLWAVPVEVDGSTLHLIVDTGAERTLLTEATVARLGMPRDPQHRTRTIAIGGIATTADATVSSFALGGFVLPVSSITVGEFAMPVRAGIPVDGLLGADILSAFDVDLDLREGQMTLYRARNCPWAGPPWTEAYVPLGPVSLARDRLLVPMVLDGKAGLATLDTGAEHSVVSDRLAERVGVLPAEMEADRSIVAHGATAEPLSVHLHRFRLLQFGPSSLADPLLPVVPMSEGLGDGLAGADFLKGRRLWLSYASWRVFMTVINPAPRVAMRR